VRAAGVRAAGVRAAGVRAVSQPAPAVATGAPVPARLARAEPAAAPVAGRVRAHLAAATQRRAAGDIRVAGSRVKPEPAAA
jgi:hypothetical protein